MSGACPFSLRGLASPCVDACVPERTLGRARPSARVASIRGRKFRPLPVLEEEPDDLRNEQFEGQKAEGWDDEIARETPAAGIRRSISRDDLQRCNQRRCTCHRCDLDRRANKTSRLKFLMRSRLVEFVPVVALRGLQPDTLLAFSTPLGVALRQVVPHAVRLFQRVLSLGAPLFARCQEGVSMLHIEGFLSDVVNMLQLRGVLSSIVSGRTDRLAQQRTREAHFTTQLGLMHIAKTVNTLSHSLHLKLESLAWSTAQIIQRAAPFLHLRDCCQRVVRTATRSIFHVLATAAVLSRGAPGYRPRLKDLDA